MKKLERRKTKMSLFWIFAFVLKYWIRNTSQFKWRTLSLTKSNVNCESEFEISLFLCFVKQLHNKRFKSFRHESVSMSFYSLCPVEHWPQIYQVSILISITPYNIFVISPTFKTVSLLGNMMRYKMFPKFYLNVEFVLGFKKWATLLK